MARTTRGWPCPRFTLMRPELKSRMRRSPACSHDPCAPVMTTCLRPACADHEMRTLSAVSCATVDGSAGRFVATVIAPSLVARTRDRRRARRSTRSRISLVASGGHLHGRFLEAGAVDVLALRLEGVGGLLREVGAERCIGGF